MESARKSAIRPERMWNTFEKGIMSEKTLHDLLRFLTDQESEALIDLLESKKAAVQSDDFPSQWRNEDIDGLIAQIHGERE